MKLINIYEIPETYLLFQRRLLLGRLLLQGHHLLLALLLQGHFLLLGFHVDLHDELLLLLFGLADLVGDFFFKYV